MRRSKAAILIICIFFIIVFSLSIALNRHFPILVVSGESSVGTWMSGVLLIISATLTLVLGMQKKWSPWLFITAFFILLAVDERFMIHEKLKEWIVFSFKLTREDFLIAEIPVILGAFLGAFIAVILWGEMKNRSRVFLLFAVTLGITSVIIDVLAAGVLWEDGLKILAELSLTCSLLKIFDV